jgi:hypothetical protein
MNRVQEETQNFLAASNKRRASSPSICEGDLIPRDHLLQHAQNELKKYDQAVFAARHTMIAPITHGIAPELDDLLRPTSLRNGVKRMNTIQKGEVLFLRTVIPPYRQVATSLLVEDQLGDVIMLNLYNFVQEDEDPRKIFPPNTCLS